MSNARAMELDATRLGDALMTAYMISVQLGHKHVANTLRDYYHPGPAEHEQAFLVDLFTQAYRRDRGTVVRRRGRVVASPRWRHASTNLGAAGMSAF